MAGKSLTDAHHAPPAPVVFPCQGRCQTRVVEGSAPRLPHRGPRGACHIRPVGCLRLAAPAPARPHAGAVALVLVVAVVLLLVLVLVATIRAASRAPTSRGRDRGRVGVPGTVYSGTEPQPDPGRVEPQPPLHPTPAACRLPEPPQNLPAGSHGNRRRPRGADRNKGYELRRHQPDSTNAAAIRTAADSEPSKAILP
jgi:hypothetical protein